MPTKNSAPTKRKKQRLYWKCVELEFAKLSKLEAEDICKKIIPTIAKTVKCGVHSGFSTIHHTEDSTSHIHVGIVLRSQPSTLYFQTKREYFTIKIGSSTYRPCLVSKLNHSLEKIPKSVHARLKIYYNYCTSEDKHVGTNQIVHSSYCYKWNPNPKDIQNDTKPKTSKLTAHAQVLKTFVEEKESLAVQMSKADYNRKAFICSHYKELKTMIYNYLQCEKDLKTETPDFIKEDFHILPEAEKTMASKTPCLILHGLSCAGKTEYANTFFKNPITCRHIDKLKEFDPLVHDGIIFDDMSFGSHKRETFMAITETNRETDITMRNYIVTIPRRFPRIFLTNRKLRNIKCDRDGDLEHDKESSFLPAPLNGVNQPDRGCDRRFTSVRVMSDLRKNPPADEPCILEPHQQ